MLTFLVFGECRAESLQKPQIVLDLGILLSCKYILASMEAKWIAKLEY